MISSSRASASAVSARLVPVSPRSAETVPSRGSASGLLSQEWWRHLRVNLHIEAPIPELAGFFPRK